MINYCHVKLILEQGSDDDHQLSRALQTSLSRIIDLPDIYVYNEKRWDGKVQSRCSLWRASALLYLLSLSQSCGLTFCILFSCSCPIPSFSSCRKVEEHSLAHESRRFAIHCPLLFFISLLTYYYFFFLSLFLSIYLAFPQVQGHN